VFEKKKNIKRHDNKQSSTTLSIIELSQEKTRKSMLDQFDHNKISQQKTTESMQDQLNNIKFSQEKTMESIQDQFDSMKDHNKLSQENMTRQIDMIVLMMKNNNEDKLDNAGY
jgi:hypothetical protein